MGKLGGQELNFSSDVDLIFLFDAHGETTGSRPLSHEEFFLRLGQLLIRYLDAPTVEGRAFRVDMRLRPFGAIGPLAASTAAFEDYLERQGRDWERYAWIKARAVTGARLYEQVFRSSVRPFVYRRYLDFGVFEALRDMKALIEREVSRRDLQDDVKLGPGGIREIEFIVQSHQLIRGGTERRLQSSSLLHTLPLLSGARLLSSAITHGTGGGLRISAASRKPPADVPGPADPRAADRPGGARADRARDGFCGLGRTERGARCPPRPRRGALCAPWCSPRAARARTAHRSPAGSRARSRARCSRRGLQGLGMRESAHSPRSCCWICAARRGRGAWIRRGGAACTLLLGQMLEEVAPLPDALAVLRRLLRVIEAIGARSAYFALLLENSIARRRLIELAGYGDFLTAQIAALPLLLDELIDDRLFEQLPARTELAAELSARLADVEAGR